ncbi:MAG: hypothetical protein Q9170_007224 [Blastenia crenularia]
MLELPVLGDNASGTHFVDGHPDLTRTLPLAEKFAFNQQKADGHWCAEYLAPVDITAQYVFFHQMLGNDLAGDASQLCKYILSLQTSDGSWGIAPDHPGSVSVTAEAYLALRILGCDTESKELLRARDFILNAGGLAKVRMLTRFSLAQFGLLPWRDVPQLPSELILLPVWSPINCFSIPVWARSALVPLAIVRHHEPIFALPNGKSGKNEFLDELWLDPHRKTAPYGRSFLDLSSDPIGFVFKAADYLVHYLRVLRYSPLRYLARKQTVKWLLQHQNQDGSWCGFTMAYQTTMIALLLEGFTVDDTPVRRGLTALETWTVEDEAKGKRIQISNSPVWDTALMIEALCVSGTPLDDDRLRRAVDWTKAQQLFGPDHDVALYCSDLRMGGGFPFQYDNSWSPDPDDTAAVILGLVAQDPSALDKYWFVSAAEWTLPCGPFNELDNLADPSTADITSRMLELCTVITRGANAPFGRPPAHLVRRAQQAIPGAIRFIASKQEADGSWWCRWGVNYVLGTNLAIVALYPYIEPGGIGPIADMVRQGVTFLLGMQHPDGGWGESVASYDIPPCPKTYGCSLPSSTGWALMGLLGAGVDPTTPSIQRGVNWLVREQTDNDGAGGASWPERQFTGVGFPRVLYLGYGFYRHYFPMLALGKYVRAVAAASKSGEEKIGYLKN